MNLKQRLTALALAAALASGTLAIGAQAAFTDTTGHWAEEAIAAVAEKKLFQGTSETTFSPDIPMNRGMFVTVLGRFSESLGHKMDGSAVFSDVAADSYCASYVAWAADHGIVNGVGDGKFAPRGTVTRQQMCAIMIRFLEYLGYPMPEGAALAFEDGSAIADYAKDAISKAVALGLMQGSSTETGVVFRPAQGATRAQVAAVFLRLDRLPGVEDLRRLRLDHVERAVRRAERQLQVPGVVYKRVRLQVPVLVRRVRLDSEGLRAHGGRPEARPGPEAGG